MEWVDRVNTIRGLLTDTDFQTAHAVSGVNFRGDDRKMYVLGEDGKLRDTAGRMFRGNAAEPIIPPGFVIPKPTVSFTCHAVDGGYKIQCNTRPDFVIEAETISEGLRLVADQW